jgi:environmental stress-induced protein Ves
MFRHLTPANYTEQPWANGRGRTIELLRQEDQGALLWRLSMAMVVEDGPFSLFPGIERNLTVLSGPGFRLKGRGIDVRCDALVPVAFPGDVPVRATQTQGQQSNDFNVMTARHLRKPLVTVEHDGSLLPAGGTLALFALGEVTVNDIALQRHDLVLTDQEARIAGRWPVVAVRLYGEAGG